MKKTLIVLGGIVVLTLMAYGTWSYLRSARKRQRELMIKKLNTITDPKEKQIAANEILAFDKETLKKEKG